MQLRTPRGVKDFPPQEAQRLIDLEQTIRQELRLWGYEEVITPTFEFLSTFEQGGTSTDQTYKFIDRDGQLVGLRSDVTTPIARMVATRFEQQVKPLRLSYLANVFRYNDVQIGWQREFYQAGVELFGSRGPVADGELIALACRLAAVSGIKDFRVDIGHAQFFQGLLNGADCVKMRQEMRQALLRQDYVKYRAILESSVLPKATKRFLGDIPNMRGKEDVIELARHNTNSKEALEALDTIAEILRVAKEFGAYDAVNVDLGLHKALDYYTGFIMEGYTSDLGFNLCSGGRYDRLCERFGSDCPATGFAFGMERLLLALDRQGNLPSQEERVLLIGEDNSEVYRVAEGMRAQGVVVELDVSGLKVPEAVAFAKQQRITSIVQVKDGAEKEVWRC